MRRKATKATVAQLPRRSQKKGPDKGPLEQFPSNRVWTFYCTLCGKSQHEVAQLIGGPSPVAPWTTQPAHGLPHHLLHAARRCRNLISRRRTCALDLIGRGRMLPKALKKAGPVLRFCEHLVAEAGNCLKEAHEPLQVGRVQELVQGDEPGLREASGRVAQAHRPWNPSCSASRAVRDVLAITGV